jgi:hypothetical protein
MNLKVNGGKTEAKENGGKTEHSWRPQGSDV